MFFAPIYMIASKQFYLHAADNWTWLDVVLSRSDNDEVDIIQFLIID